MKVEVKRNWIYRSFCFIMAQGKKSFIAYSDWQGTFKALPDEIAGQLIKYIFSYVNDENPEPHENFVVNALFEQFKATLKRDLDKWDKQREQRSLAGKRSAELRATKTNERSTTVNEQARKPTVNVSDSVNVSVNDSDSVNVSIDIFPDFNDFWDLYDKKVDRSKCEKKWNKLKQEEKEQIIDYIPLYIKSQPNKIYRKNPETFLNNKSWLNEIIQEQQINGKLKNTLTAYEKARAELNL